MKIINTQPPEKFTDRVFTVQMTGAELAFIKCFTGTVTGLEQTTVRGIASSIHRGIPEVINRDDNGNDAQFPTQVNLSSIPLHHWLEKINKLNK